MNRTMPQTVTSVIDLIGNTPLIRLKGPSEATGCDIYGKAEFLNPGQSVKDRAALWIIRDAEARGVLKPGGTIVEGTAGNTGIGLAMVANALGYTCKIVIPRTPGAGEERRHPTVGRRIDRGRRPALCESRQLCPLFRPAGRGDRRRLGQPVRQRRQPPRPHIDATGPEIMEQTGGKIDGFICAVGSGGHARRHQPLHEGAESRHPDRSGRPIRRGALQLLHHRRAEIGGFVDHRRHRPGPHHRQSRRRRGRPVVPGGPTRNGCRCCTT